MRRTVQTHLPAQSAHHLDAHRATAPSQKEACVFAPHPPPRPMHYRLSLLGLLWHKSTDWVTNWVTLAGCQVKVPGGVWWGPTPWFAHKRLAELSTAELWSLTPVRALTSSQGLYPRDLS